MALPNPTELELLPKFRAAIANLNLDDHQNSDAQLLRWLRARSLDLKKSEDMIRNAIKWRKEHDVDNCQKWTFSEYFLKEFPYEISGYTENNTPVFVFPFGLYDVKKVAETGRREEFIKFVIYFYEQFDLKARQRMNPRTNFPSTQIILIVDCDKYSYTQLASIGACSILLEFVKMFDHFYPEILEAGFVINSPKIFTILFGMMKPLLDQRTVDKISIFSTDQKQWKPALCQAIPVEALPPKYGGSATACIVNHKGEKEVKYRKIDQISTADGETEYLEMDDTVHQVEIEARFKKRLVFETIEPNQTVSWTFKVEKYDIGYSILDVNEKEILNYKKSTEETGSLVLEIPGIYYFAFDNSYSLTREKSITLQIKSEPKSVIENLPVLNT